MSAEKIVLFALGGTIASRKSDSGRAQSGAMSGVELAEALGLDLDVALDFVTLRNKASNAITIPDLLDLRTACEQAVAEGATGIVVTQGTDTLEDTAYLLHLLLDLPVGVVVTGAQRVPYAPSSDAAANVRDAVTVARQRDRLAGRVVVVFNEEIHSARLVRKISSYRLGGFGSPGHGPLGHVDGDQVTLAPEDRPEPRIGALRLPLPRVDILTVSLGAEPALLEASAASGADGIVIDGVGRGHVPPDWMPVLRRLRAGGLPVCITSSTLSGALRQDYEYPGSLAEMVAIGIVPVDELTARKARLRMICDLASGAAS